MEQICRFCLKNYTKSSISLSDDAIQCKIKTLFTFPLESGPSLPNMICEECTSKIDEFYTFSEMVRNNEQQLLSRETVVPKVEVVELDRSLIKEDKLSSDSEENESKTFEVQVEFIQLKTKIEDDSDETDDGTPVAVRCQKRINTNSLIKEDNTLKCDKDSFKSLQELKRHTLTDHRKSVTINTLRNKHGILNHIQHSDPSRFQCAICQKSFKTKYTLERHCSIVHGIEKSKRFRCDQCDASFHELSELKDHREIHEKLECHICHQVYLTKTALRKHLSRIHETTKENFICDSCGEGYRNISLLNRHISRTHLGHREERVQCDTCDTWVNKCNIKKHIDTVHSGINAAVTCDICHQVYPNRKSMVTHKWRVHVEEKFQCEYCDRKFKRRVTLQEHRASHTGQRLYQCDLCGMSTNSNGNLYSHKKNKHPDEWMEAKRKSTGGFLDEAQNQ
ncbi:GDNF-inducible zinc finger protein 1-like [Topomyia yanbarensis]|uniref:GDNF-inducible zinc finger protein 1-like n=1 Tax=Topomyia yanbarensis TaxID=2498891 RepID=UPI00273B5A55|nr:GDNF-inducible zinc finger protein 1-like [Topomyia yanbarensis]